MFAIKHHAPKQWEAIHVNFAKFFFIIDPPLKPSTMEKYFARAPQFYKAKKEATLEGRRGCN
jgi:hypothetical protein